MNPEQLKNENPPKKRRRWLKVILVILCVPPILLLTGVGVLAWMYQSGGRSLRERGGPAPKVPVLHAEPIPGFAEGKEGTEDSAQEESIPEELLEYREEAINILLLGVDKRGKLSAEPDFSNHKAGQADAVFVISLDTASKEAAVVAVPRNSMVNLEIFGTDGTPQEEYFNALCLQYGFAGGGSFGMLKTKERVSEILYEIPIHASCALGMDAIGKAADIVGGVEVELSETDIRELGWKNSPGDRVTIDSRNAYAYLHDRIVEEDGSPTIRLTRQKNFLKLLLDKLMEKPENLPGLALTLYQELSPYLVTDLNADETVYLAGELAQCRFADSAFYQLEGRNLVESNEEGKSFDNFYLDPESVRRTVMRAFYRRAEEQANNKQGKPFDA